ncbi:putative type I restriction-modification system S protein [Streptococcus pneumoniae]|nr:putative type I restriction-modification system S protein [Streptococcus pneumoniae]
MSFKLSIGKVAILDIPATHNEAIISIFPYANKENIIRDYLMIFLPLISTLGDSKDAIKGKTLNSTSISELLIPISNHEEMKRIVISSCSSKGANGINSSLSVVLGILYKA